MSNKRKILEMKFDKDIAEQLVKKYDLNEKTIRTWKNRDSIPDRYLDENFKPSTTFSASTVSYDRLLVVMSLPSINRTEVCRIANVSINNITDALRKKITLSESDYLQLTVELKRLSLFMKKCVADKNFYDLLNDPRLFYRPLLHSLTNDEYKIFSKYRKNQNIRNYIDSFKDKILNDCTVFVLSLVL